MKLLTTYQLLDGGMGRELSRRGAPFRQPEWSALALWEAADIVQAIHEDFICAGAQIITTNSYAIVPFHIGEERFAAEGKRLASLSGELAQAAVAARKKITATTILIAGSLPPLFGSYRPDLFDTSQAQRLAQPLINGLSPYVDLWLLETQASLIEPLSIIPLLPNDNKPIWVAFTLEDEQLQTQPILRSGEAVKDVVNALISLNINGILFNCSQPEVMSDAIRVTKNILTAHQVEQIQIGCYANAFSPHESQGDANNDIREIRHDLSPAEYLKWAKQWRVAGADIIGGCCGISPQHIQVLAENLQ